MSSIDDCTSQDIEASSSSVSTGNSKKYSFVQAILKNNDSQMLCNYGPRIDLPEKRVVPLPVLEKNDFIQNWIIAHSNLAKSPEKSYPGSPVLGIPSVKRSPQSPILGYQWKRIKREACSKENCRVSLNAKFKKARPSAPATSTIKTEFEDPRLSKPELFDDTDKTLTSGYSPVLNGITNSPTLSASRVSYRPSWPEKSRSPRKFDGTLKQNGRQSLVRGSSNAPEALSLSSPLAERNERLKIGNTINDQKQIIENRKKVSDICSEILAEETPLEDEIISSSSKIPETLSLSTIVDDDEGLEVDPKTSNFLQADTDSNKVHHRPLCFSPIKLKAKSLTSHVIPSDRSSPLRTNDLKSITTSRTGTKNSPSKSDAAETSPVLDRYSKIRESSQIAENLDPGYLNSVKKLSLTASLAKNVPGVKSVNSSWIEAKKSSRKGEAACSAKSIDRSNKIRESSEVPKTLSGSTQLGERNERLRIEKTTNDQKQIIEKLKKVSDICSGIIVEESPLEDEIISSSSKIPETLSVSTVVDDDAGLEVDSKTSNFLQADTDSNKVHRRPFCFSPIKVKAESSSDYVISWDRSSLLSANNFKGVKSNITSWTTTKNSPSKSEAVETSPTLDRCSKIRESSQIAENLDPEYLNSVKQSSLTASLAKNVPGVKSVNSFWIEAKKSSIKCEAVSSAQFIDRSNKIRESSKIPKILSGSSQIIDNERIDFESNITNPHDHDIQFESDSDATISDFIENADTQKFDAIALRNSSGFAKRVKLEEQRTDFVERIPQHAGDRSCDSDETHYSDGDSIPKLRIIDACSVMISQHISQATSHSDDDRVSANRSEILISQTASPVGNNNSEPPANAPTANTTHINNKKKRKAKKGSLVAKLEAMISSQVSNFRIWQYQMSQPDFKNSRLRFVTLKIREHETRYGRHYLTASVIEDPQDLLKSLFESGGNLPNKKSESRSEMRIVTIVMIPEIIGVVKIRDDSGLKIYPPWDIMDHARKILNVTFFNVIAVNEINVDTPPVITRENKRIINDFECPCIREKRLVESCREKFTNTKPSVMREMFDF